MKKYCSNPICNNEIEGMGNNPQPFLDLKVTDCVCNICNEEFVIPARLGEPVSEFIRLMILGFQKNQFDVQFYMANYNQYNFSNNSRIWNILFRKINFRNLMNK